MHVVQNTLETSLQTAYLHVTLTSVFSIMLVITKLTTFESFTHTPTTTTICNSRIRIELACVETQIIFFSNTSIISEK